MAHPERFALHFDATYRLLSLSLKPSTRARYQGGVDCFRQFLCHYLSLPALPRSFRSSAVRLDRLFATFTMFAFEDDLPFSSVKAAFWGLKKLNPQLGKFGLPVSFSLVCKSWQRLRPSKSALPISWPLTCLLAATLLESGHTRAAVLALLSFDCYLRVNEGCTLLKEDVVWVEGLPSLRLRNTKTGGLQDQFVAARHPDVCRLLHRVWSATEPGHRLFPFSAVSFRSRLRRAERSLGFPVHFTPHSFRHGGASHDLRAGCPIAEVVLRGRWASVESSRRYFQQHRARFLEVLSLAAESTLGVRISRCLLGLFAGAVF